MPRRLLIALISLTLFGCGHSQNNNGDPPPPTTQAGAQYFVTIGTERASAKPLNNRETVSVALAANAGNSVHGPITVVLVRQGPEGKTRELIEVGANGRLLEPTQDYLLRDGDELIIPSPPARHD